MKGIYKAWAQGNHNTECSLLDHRNATTPCWRVSGKGQLLELRDERAS